MFTVAPVDEKTMRRREGYYPCVHLPERREGVPPRGHLRQQGGIRLA
jgi:hypothetical protein